MILSAGAGAEEDPFSGDVSGDCPDQGLADGPPSYTSTDGENWTVHCDSGVDFAGPPIGAFGMIFFLALLIGIGVLIWKVTTARQLARDAGMDPGQATAMTLLTDTGLEATYIASQVRRGHPDGGEASQPARPTVAERLSNLEQLRADGVITEDEHNQRRQAILDAL